MSSIGEERLSPHVHREIGTPVIKGRKYGGVRYQNAMPRNKVSYNLFHNKVMRKRFCGFTLAQAILLLVIIAYFVIMGVHTYNGTKWTFTEKTADQSIGDWLVANENALWRFHMSFYAWMFEWSLPLLLLPLNHNPNGLFPYLLGSTYEHLLEMHKLVGIIAIVFGAVHTGSAIGFFYNLMGANFTRVLKQAMNFTGVIAMALFLLIFFTSIKVIRRHIKYEVFYIIHMTSAIGAFICLFFHVRQPTTFMKTLAVPGALWIIDLLWRLYHVVYGARAKIVSKVVCETTGATILELEPSNNSRFHFEPGQWGYLCVPGVSRLEYHPFALLAAPSCEVDPQNEHNNKMAILIKTLGDWTKVLEKTPISRLTTSNCIVHGPIGCTPFVYEDCTSIILLGAGAGIAPTLGHAQRILFSAQTLNRDEESASLLNAPGKTKIVWVVLSVQHRDMLVYFESTIKNLQDSGLFRVVCYETRTCAQDEEVKIDIPIQGGRPDLMDLIENAYNENRNYGRAKMCCVCAGTDEFQKVATKACNKFGIPIINECGGW